MNEYELPPHWCEYSFGTIGKLFALRGGHRPRRNRQSSRHTPFIFLILRQSLPRLRRAPSVLNRQNEDGSNQQNGGLRHIGPDHRRDAAERRVDERNDCDDYDRMHDINAGNKFEHQRCGIKNRS